MMVCKPEKNTRLGIGARSDTELRGVLGLGHQQSIDIPDQPFPRGPACVGSIGRIMLFSGVVSKEVRRSYRYDVERGSVKEMWERS